MGGALVLVFRKAIDNGVSGRFREVQGGSEMGPPEDRRQEDMKPRVGLSYLQGWRLSLCTESYKSQQCCQGPPKSCRMPIIVCPIER